MTDRVFVPGKFTDLQDQRQLGRLNDVLQWILSVVNRLDPNAFALAWIEGFAAGAVIASKGVGNSPEWDTTPLLTGLKLSGLSASKLVATDSGRNLVSDANTYVVGAASYRLFVSDTEPSAPHQVNDIWIDTSV